MLPTVKSFVRIMHYGRWCPRQPHAGPSPRRISLDDARCRLAVPPPPSVLARGVVSCCCYIVVEERLILHYAHLTSDVLRLSGRSRRVPAILSDVRVQQQQ